MSDADSTITGGSIDYEFWSRMAGWTAKEAAALLLDIDPDNIPSDSFELGSLRYRHDRLFRLLDRACKMDELDSPMVPRDFLTWAVSNGIKPPKKLIALVRAGKPHRNWRSRYFAMKRERDKSVHDFEVLSDQTSNSLNERPKQTLLKLVGGMARDKFGHDPKKPGTAGKIEAALDRVDWHVSNNTIKGYLDESDELYDQDHPNRK
jgi:hypothetical protein